MISISAIGPSFRGKDRSRPATGGYFEQKNIIGGKVETILSKRTSAEVNLKSGCPEMRHFPLVCFLSWPIGYSLSRIHAVGASRQGRDESSRTARANSFPGGFLATPCLRSLCYLLLKLGLVCRTPQPVGETPMGATETVALPIFSVSFRPSCGLGAFLRCSLRPQPVESAREKQARSRRCP